MPYFEALFMRKVHDGYVICFTLLEAVDARIPVTILGDINVSYTWFLATNDVFFSSLWYQIK
jgi:hypothetical protein